LLPLKCPLFSHLLAERDGQRDGAFARGHGDGHGQGHARLRVVVVEVQLSRNHAVEKRQVLRASRGGQGQCARIRLIVSVHEETGYSTSLDLPPLGDVRVSVRAPTPWLGAPSHGTVVFRETTNCRKGTCTCACTCVAPLNPLWAGGQGGVFTCAADAGTVTDTVPTASGVTVKTNEGSVGWGSRWCFHLRG
jgi:hypothetical protein